MSNPMRPPSFIRWFRARRESRHLALVAECANLVIQQHGQAWSNAKCSHCQLPISEIGNYCPWCGTSFIPPMPVEEPEQPVASAPVPVFSYEIPEHQTSGYRLSAVKQLVPDFTPPKRPLPPKGRMASLIRTQKVTAQQHQQAMKAGKLNGGKK